MLNQFVRGNYKTRFRGGRNLTAMEGRATLVLGPCRTRLLSLHVGHALNPGRPGGLGTSPFSGFAPDAVAFAIRLDWYLG